MNDNVIYPKSFTSGALGEGTQQRAEDRQKLEDERNKRWIARLREIEDAEMGTSGTGKKGHVFKDEDDRILAALAVGELVRQAKTSKHITVEEIKDALPRTKRLDRYMLRPGFNPTVARAKCKKLQQRVRGYLEIAEVVAKLTGWDPDTLKIRVLRGTSLWSQPSAAQTEDDPRASHLAMELNEMGRAVVRRTGLENLFTRARRIPGIWDVATQSFRPSKMACLFQAAYLDWFEHWTEAPPLPSVPLVRCMHAVFPTVVRIETLGRAERLAGDAAHDASFVGAERDAWFELSREIRIALGPTTSADDVGPMFESRAHVSLCLDEPSSESHVLWPNVSLKAVDDGCRFLPTAVFQVQIDGLWHRVATESLDEIKVLIFRPGDDPIGWSPDPLDPKSFPYEHWYFSWAAINSESVRHWLDRPWNLSKNTSVVVPYEGSRDAHPVWYATPSAAHHVEYALACGALEKALDAAVQHLREMLEQWETQWRIEASAAHGQRMATWQQDQ